jgi:hypothetical protein
MPSLYGNNGGDNLQSWENSYNTAIQDGTLDPSLFTGDNGQIMTYTEAFQKSGMTPEEFSLFLTRQLKK